MLYTLITDVAIIVFHGFLGLMAAKFRVAFEG